MKSHPLKVEREQHGWSQGRVAEALGTTIRTVSRWEQGIAMPSPYYREQLCTLFSKNTKQLGLLSGTDEDEIEEESLLPFEIQPSSLPHLIQESVLVDPAIPQAVGSASSLLGRAGLFAHVKQHLVEGDNLALTALNGFHAI